MTVNSDNTCTAVIPDLQENCQADVNAHYSSDKNGTPAGFEINRSNWREVPACSAHIESLGCTPI